MFNTINHMEPVMKLSRILLSVVLTLSLFACGGGGGTSASSDDTTSAGNNITTTSTTTTSTTPCSVDIPANITAQPGNAQITVSWSSFVCADSYTVYLSDNEGGCLNCV